MKNQTYLAFDYGEKYIGVAVGQSQTALAHALDTVLVHGQPDWEHVTRLLDEWKPDALVVGLPLNMDGTENPLTQAARKFGNRLTGRYNLPVHMVDERLTSIAAKEALAEAGIPHSRQMQRRHKPKVDKLAAQTILQAFLDAQRRTQHLQDTQ